MKDEHGNIMTEKQILKITLDLLSDICCLLYETESDASIAAAYMADSLMKYIQVIYRGDDVLLASADYSNYEKNIYDEYQKNDTKLKLVQDETLELCPHGKPVKYNLCYSCNIGRLEESKL